MTGKLTEAARRAAFARALARSLFGKHYWDEPRQAERRMAGEKKKRPREKRVREKPLKDG